MEPEPVPVPAPANTTNEASDSSPAADRPLRTLPVMTFALALLVLLLAAGLTAAFAASAKGGSAGRSSRGHQDILWTQVEEHKRLETKVPVCPKFDGARHSAASTRRRPSIRQGQRIALRKRLPPGCRVPHINPKRQRVHGHWFFRKNALARAAGSYDRLGRARFQRSNPGCPAVTGIPL